MKILLSIDHATYLLPDDKSIGAVQKALSQAIRCDDERYMHNKHIGLRDPVSVKVEYLPPTTKFQIGEQEVNPFKAPKAPKPLRLGN